MHKSEYVLQDVDEPVTEIDNGIDTNFSDCDRMWSRLRQ